MHEIGAPVLKMMSDSPAIPSTDASAKGQAARPHAASQPGQDGANSPGQVGGSSAPGPGEDTETWAEGVKDYYRHVEFYDWVEVADHFRGPETLFHRSRARDIRRIVAKHAAPGHPMLDAGCGTGLNLRNLPEGSVGLDINPRHVAVVEERLPNHTIALGDVEEMPFEDGAFGSVLCTEIIEHVPDPLRALAEIRRVLRPGGVLIGSVPAKSLVWRLRFLSVTCPGEEPFHTEYRRHELATLLQTTFEILMMRRSLQRLNHYFVVRKG